MTETQAVSLRTPSEEQWTCAYCGLTHSHGRSIEDIRSLDFVTPEIVRAMNYNPQCNCGKYELFVSHKSGVIDIPDECINLFKFATAPEDTRSSAEAISL